VNKRSTASGAAVGSADIRAVVDGYRLRAVIAMQVAFVIGAAIGVSLYIHDPGVTIPGMLALSCSVASLLLALRNRLVLSTRILAVQLIALPPALAMNETGMYDAAMFLMPVTMMMIALTERPLFVWLFNAAVLSSAAFMFYATVHGLNGQHLSADPPLHLIPDGFTILIILVLCCFVTGYLAHMLERLLDTLMDDHRMLELRVVDRTAELSDALSDLQTMQNELVHSEKLASLGALVAGISHELNTPIGNALTAATTAKQYVRQFRAQLEAGAVKRSSVESFLDASEEMSDVVARSSERAAALIVSFKKVAVDQTSERRRSFDLREVVGDVIETLRPGLKRRVAAFDIDIARDILCDTYPGPLEQVITNLVQNAAVHAFERRSNGRVRLSAEAEGEHIALHVDDDGSGMEPHVLAHIFDPFYTTRLGQGGSGLGLSISRRIATSILEGDLKCSSTPGKGTRFTLRFARVASGKL
jgi:signal transduction histidine kinase